MQTQSCQISELRSVVDYVELQKVAGKKDEGVDMRTMAKNIEFNMSKLIEEYMNRFEREHTKRLDQFLAARLVSNGRRRRKFRFDELFFSLDLVMPKTGSSATASFIRWLKLCANK